MTAATGAATVPQLAAMIDPPAGQPFSISAASAQWRSLATAAGDTAGQMDTGLNQLMSQWQSQQAQPAFEQNVRPLIATVRSAGGVAGVISGLLETTEADLVDAQQQMAPLLTQYNNLLAMTQLNPASVQAQLLALDQQAAAIVSKLSQSYSAVATQIRQLGTTKYDGPTSPGNAASPSGGSAITSPGTTQSPNVQSAAAAAQNGGGQNGGGANAAGQNNGSGGSGTAAQIAKGQQLAGVTKPTSAGTVTPPFPGTGGSTIPSLPTIPTAGTPGQFTVPPLSNTASPSYLPATGGYYGESFGGGGGGGYSSGHPSSETTIGTAESLPSQAASHEAATAAEPAAALGGDATASGEGAGMPFFPGMMGAPGMGASARNSGRRSGNGLFDDEELADGPGGRRAERLGVIEAEDFDAPFSRARGVKRRQAGDGDLRALPSGPDAPILATDPTDG